MKMLRPQYTFNTAARLHPARHPFLFLTFFILFLFLTFNNLHSTTHITVNNIIKSPPEREHKLYVGRQIPTPTQKPTYPTISPLPRFLANGLLEVSPDILQRHPIHDLISYAEEEWNRKLKRASKTLEEAVMEYERRYGRSPPRGFDKWWEYVQKHNVQLPDEYDQIHRDLQPFWGMSPADLNRIAREFEAHKDSYTLAKGPSVSDPEYNPAHSDSESPIIKLVNSSLPEERFDFHMDGALSIIMLLEDVEEDLSPFRAVFVPHDNPEHAFDWEVKQFALHNAAYGTHMDAFDTSIPPSSNGWLSSCDPLSAARQKPIDFTAPPPPPEGKSFIYDHRKVMDPCEHPSLLRSHGQFLAYHQGHQPHGILYPNFAYSPSMLHQDITLAHTISWREDEEADKEKMPEWDEKTDDRLEWRGKNTGIWFGADYDWHLSHRARLMEWANGGETGLAGNVTILTEEEEVEGHAKLESITVNRTQYAPAMLDIGFVEGPEGQCSERVCPKLLGLYDFHRRPHSQKQTSRYKYIIDVDGNAWSARFHRLLLKTNSLIFKSTVYPEWWADRVQPWVHYVPVQNDYSDLWDSLVFFRGKLDGRGKHEEEAKKIAQAGKEWARTFWRREDMTAYNFRLFLEYARVMSPNRTLRDWNYILPPRRRVS